jgi:SAM-dependent methyltransferase
MSEAASNFGVTLPVALTRPPDNMPVMQDPQPGDAPRRLVVAPRVAGDEPALEFGEYYYRNDCGTPYRRDADWLDMFDRLADRIVAELAPRTVLDAGCALGLLVEKLRDRGVEAWGIDVSEYAIGQVDDSVREFCFVGSLTEPLPSALPPKFDLVTCIEVLEHMRPSEGADAAGRLAAIAERILFSSSPADYGEATHVNVQPPEYWSAFFARHGQFRNADADVRFLTPWAVLYEQGSTDIAEVVRRDDRTVVRLVNELRDVRETALRLQNRVAALEAEGNGALVAEMEATIAHAAEIEGELAKARALLGSRAGRCLRAWYAAKSAFRRGA